MASAISASAMAAAAVTPPSAVTCPAGTASHDSVAVEHSGAGTARLSPASPQCWLVGYLGSMSESVLSASASSPTPSRLFRRATTLDALNDLSRDTAIAALGVVFTEIGPDYLRATMPVDTRTLQPYG